MDGWAISQAETWLDHQLKESQLMAWTLLEGQSQAELLKSLFRDLSCSVSLSVASERG